MNNYEISVWSFSYTYKPTNFEKDSKRLIRIIDVIRIIRRVLVRINFLLLEVKLRHKANEIEPLINPE